LNGCPLELNDSVPWGYKPLENVPRAVADPTGVVSVEFMYAVNVMLLGSVLELR